MKKIQIKIPLILPEVPDEKDKCLDRLILQIQGKYGLEEVHISDQTDNGVPQLCFHYDPELISIERIRQLAEQTGADLTHKFGHLLLEVFGIRHTRHARIIEGNLRSREGILEASVSASGMVRLEFDTTKTDENEILNAIRHEDLEIGDTKKNGERFFEHSDKTDKEKSQQKEQKYKEDRGHNHTHNGLLGKNTELIFSLICGLLLGTGFGLSFTESGTFLLNLPLFLYMGAYFFGGFFTAKEAIETVSKGGFEIDFLMLVAAIGAAILGEWAEGALLLFLFSLGHALEHYAMNRAHKSIAALAELAPKTALLKHDGKTREVGIEELHVGDIIIVKPHSKISADGVVINGKSSVNQAPITGESVPVDKVPVDNLGKDWTREKNIRDENRAFSGTINGNNTLEIKVIKEAKDSTLARLVKLVNEAQTQKSPTQRLTDKFEKYFVPSVLALVVILNFAFLVINESLSESFYRAMAVLVAASPCALAISTPSAVLSGVARAARKGVLIKGGRPLEDLGVLTAIAFDKTGTLTEGEPKLTEVIALGDRNENEILKIAVAVEALSDHPLAKAIVRDGKVRLNKSDYRNANNLEVIMGKGIKASLDNEDIFIGNLNLFESLDNNKPAQKIVNRVKTLESDGNTTMLIRQNADYIGIIALMDTPRKEAKDTIRELKKTGINRIIMLTGDNQNVADAVAEEIGLTEARGGLLPEEKVEAMKELREIESKAAMVGDGVNDAPAMASSTVGIAMGAAGSDVALETADIALMADKLDTLPFAIGLSRKAKTIIRQNLMISMGIVVLLIPLTVFGIASIGPAVLIHEGSTLLVVFNALRLLAYKKAH